MYKKHNCDLRLDLVFQSNNFSKISDYSLNKSDNLILQSSFWEEVLLFWIEIILEKKDIYKNTLTQIMFPSSE